MIYKKRNIEYFINYAKEKNGKCLSKTYKNTKSVLEFKCNNNHIWKTNVNNIIYNNSWCPYCSNRAKDNIKTFKKIAIERGGECLSDVYVNSKFKLKFKCANNHIWYGIPENIKNNNSWCPICIDKNIPLSINEMKKIAIERGGECLSDVYINNNTDLIWKCEFGHIWKASPNRIKSAKTWCLECSGSKKKTIEFIQEEAKKRKGKCLSDKYNGVNSKLIWECEYGHIWKTTYNTIRHNSWCPICKESKGEKIIRNFLNKKNINFIGQKRFKECKDIYPLPFDFYIPEYNILIEYDGILHYESIKHFGGDENFKLRQIHDNIKTNYCKNNNINLIRIPYFVKNLENELEIMIIK